MGVPVADLTAALFAANAIQAALLARERSGQGQLIDVCLFEAAVALEVWETSGYFATGAVPRPLGSAHRTSAPLPGLPHRGRLRHPGGHHPPHLGVLLRRPRPGTPAGRPPLRHQRPA